METIAASVTPDNATVAQHEAMWPVQTTLQAPVIERSAQVGALMGALARAQAQMHNPVFDSENGHFRTRYASLKALREAVVPPLTAEGIAVTQFPTVPEPGWVAVTTGLWHGTSGQYLLTTMQIPVPKDDPQGYGIATTYCKRYGLQAVCCVAGDEDDDAESLRDTRATRPEANEHIRAPHQNGQAVSPGTGKDDPHALRLREIQGMVDGVIKPLNHTGLYKAMVFHSFGVESPAKLLDKSLASLELGMPLFRQLCAALREQGKPTIAPDAWVRQEVQRLAAQRSEGDLDEEPPDMSTAPGGFLDPER